MTAVRALNSRSGSTPSTPPHNNNNNHPNNNVKTYDVVVVGGGSAGLTAAKFAKTFGHSVVIVEGTHMGGDCTWAGCIPSKSLLAAAARQHYQPSSSSFVDFSAIRKEIQEKIKRIYEAEDSPQVMAKLGIDVMEGYATLISSNRLQVVVVDDTTTNSNTSMELVAQQGIILCTGARPRMPTTEEIPGLDSIDYLTYEQVWDLTELPKRLTIAGGGPVSGCLGDYFFSQFPSWLSYI